MTRYANPEHFTRALLILSLNYRDGLSIGVSADQVNA